jgi:GntR family transcriptional regulator
VLPFSVEIKPGSPIAEQVVFAVKKALVTGQLAPGTPFPSVRRLSQELGINPNTAHRIVEALVGEGVLTTTPAVGSVVADLGTAGRFGPASLLDRDLERLVVEAKKLGLTLEEISAGLGRHWQSLAKKGFVP